MDPITLILAALAAGATSGLRDTAASAVKDAYSGLKSLIRRRFGDADPAVDADLEAIDKNPGIDTSKLRSLLQQVGAADDKEAESGRPKAHRAGPGREHCHHRQQHRCHRRQLRPVDHEFQQGWLSRHGQLESRTHRASLSTTTAPSSRTSSRPLRP